MSGFTRNRLERLERHPGRPCPECGAGNEAPVTYEVIFVEDDSEAGEKEEEFCSVCGKQTLVTITWGDEQTPGGGGRTYWPIVRL